MEEEQISVDGWSENLAIVAEKRSAQKAGGCVGVLVQFYEWNRRLAKRKFFSRKLLASGMLDCIMPDFGNVLVSVFCICLFRSLAKECFKELPWRQGCIIQAVDGRATLSSHHHHYHLIIVKIIIIITIHHMNHHHII